MKIGSIQILLLSLVILAGCSKSDTPSIDVELLTAAPWKLYRLDTIDYNAANKIIQKKSALVSDCQQTETLRFYPDFSVVKGALCAPAEPMEAINGQWKQPDDRSIYYVFRPGTDYPLSYQFILESLSADTLQWRQTGVMILSSTPYVERHYRQTYIH